MEFRILGGVEAHHEGTPVDLGPPKQRAVLAVLLLEAGRVVAADRLIDLLWGEDAPKAEASLRAYVSNLRKAIEPDRAPRAEPSVLVTQPPGYRLVVERDAVDALRFEDLVGTGRRHLLAGEHDEAAAAFDDALRLWHGPPVPELGADPVAVEAARRLGDARLAAVEGLADARLAQGDPAGAVTLLEPEVDANPLRERLHALLALALYRCGRQADALRVIQRCRDALVDTAGLDPGPELRRLEADVLAHAPHLDHRPPAASLDTGSAPAATGIVGRDRELESLTRALAAALDGHGTAVVVAGEPGIGKTRLIEELAARARAAGAVVAWTRCPESGAMPAYWPATQLGAQLRAQGIDAADLPAEAPGVASQFALHERITHVLVQSRQPMLLVLDDVQWADADSLRLLAHTAGELADAPILVAVTTRPLDEEAPSALVDALGELVRLDGAVHLSLGPLDRDAVGRWLHVDEAVAAAVHERTGGNALFVKELGELLRTEGEGAARALPAGVQLVVRRRVSKLPAATQRLLTVAAVVGRTFDVDIVADVAGEPVDEVLDHLSPAFDAGLVTADGMAYSFSHALVADALAAEVNAARSARFHAAAARAMVARGWHDTDAATVAHHALAGAVAGTADLAFEASARAARLATARLAHEDAARHWRQAVGVLEHRRGGDRRVEALFELGAACFRADLIEEAKDACLRAVEQSDDVEVLARAAVLLDNPGLWPNQRYGVAEHRVRDACRRIVERLPPERTHERIRAYGAMTGALCFTSASERDTESVETAIGLARETRDRRGLAFALVNRHHVHWCPDGLEERRAAATELVSIADDDELELLGLSLLAAVEYEDADLSSTGARLDRCLVLADRLGAPGHRSVLGWFAAGLAVVHGRYDEARRLGEEATDIYRRTRSFDVDLIAIGLHGAIAADVGGLEEVLARAGDVDPGPYAHLLTEYTAFLLHDAGMGDLVEPAPVPPWTDDFTTLLTTSAALHVRAEIGDEDGCRVLVERLRPFAGRWSVSGTGPTSCGLTDLALARGSAVLGEEADARRWFAAAVAGHERLDAPAWLARSLLHQGRFLEARGEDGADALARARSIAETYGFPTIARRAN